MQPYPYPLTLRRLNPAQACSAVTSSSRARAATRSSTHYPTMCSSAHTNARTRGRGASSLDVALRAGYQTEAAFNRAFKREMGVTPGAVRRAAVGRA